MRPDKEKRPFAAKVIMLLGVIFFIVFLMVYTAAETLFPSVAAVSSDSEFELFKIIWAVGCLIVLAVCVIGRILLQELYKIQETLSSTAYPKKH